MNNFTENSGKIKNMVAMKTCFKIKKLKLNVKMFSSKNFNFTVRSLIRTF